MRKPPLILAFGACLFLLIAGAKWATFERFGSPMPNWDQWDAEAAELLVPWFEKKDFFRHLFQPHNEHRVILTKLQNLALVLVNGQWDSRLEAVANAMLHSALGVAFWLCAQLWIGRPLTPRGDPGRFNAGSANLRLAPGTTRTSGLLAAATFALAFILFGLPVAWQNVLGGFHSQQYWLLGLSFAAIVTLPFARTWSLAWWLGAGSAVLALGSMGSGFLAAAAVFGLVTWRAWAGQARWREAWPTLALTAALVAFGAATRVEVAHHQSLKAKTAHDFVFSTLHSLEWPLRDHMWAAAILWLPWVLVAGQVIRSRARPGSTDGASPASPAPADSRPPQTIATLGAWVIAQIGATAYARGAGADFPASRYMDTLTFGSMVNGGALAWLLATAWAGTPGRARGGQNKSGPTRSTYAIAALALVWLVALGLGLHGLLEGNLRYQLPDEKSYYVKAEGHMRRYLATDDPAALAYPDIPYPSAGALVERLAHPSLRALMPLPIRAPLAVTAATETSPFIEHAAGLGSAPRDVIPRGLSPPTPSLDAVRSWGSFTREGNAATGGWKSRALAAPNFGWLKFETAGHVQSAPVPAVSLALHDAATGALLRHVHPAQPPGASWRSVYVRAPRQPFVIVADDHSLGEWLAFSAPVEMGALSYWAWRATVQGTNILWGAGVVTALLALVCLRRGQKTRVR